MSSDKDDNTKLDSFSIRKFKNGAISIQSPMHLEDCNYWPRVKKLVSCSLEQIKDTTKIENNANLKTKRISSVSSLKLNRKPWNYNTDVRNKSTNQLQLNKESKDFLERQKQVELWFAKKMQEKKEKVKIEKRLMENEKIVEAQKMSRCLENELTYKLWLKKKEQEVLENQLRQLKQNINKTRIENEKPKLPSPV